MKIAFQNVNGICDDGKRAEVENALRDLNYDLIFLLDTRLGEKKQKSQLQKEKWKPYFSGNRQGKRGIKAFLNPNSPIKVKKFHSDPQGNFLILECIIQDTPTVVTGIYGPNDDDTDWWTRLHNKIELLRYQNVIMGGDTNIILDHEKDSKGYKRVWYPNKRRLFNDWFDSDIYIDVYRDLYPHQEEYSKRYAD